jgi:hypothetical protein
VVLEEASASSDVLVSCGVGEDVRFERDFYDSFSASGILVDPYISDETVASARAEAVFAGELVGTHGVVIDPNVTMQDLVSVATRIAGQNNPRVTLKIDIEWDEWSMFETLDWNLMKNVDQMLVEFHFVPVEASLGKHLSPYFSSFQWLTSNKLNAELAMRYEKVVANIEKYFDCFHLHANNSIGVHSYFGETVPYLLEASFINKTWSAPGNSDMSSSFNQPLDFPNKVDRPDISGLGFQKNP